MQTYNKVIDTKWQEKAAQISAQKGHKEKMQTA